MRASIIITLACMLTGNFFTVHAQDAAGKITGMVLDATKQPVIAATVILKKLPDSAIQKMALSDTTGVYVFEQIPYGSYFVTVTAMGYSAVMLQPFELSDAVAEQPGAVLPISSYMLKGVKISGQRPLVEQQIDRTIVNVDAMVTAAGGSAMEVLERSPGLSVDKDGNIAIKGKQGVKVFVDGKPSFLSGADLANLLRNMQASQVDQVEIMSNPPAKYDASGNGVVNIKTKRLSMAGFNGSVVSSYSQGKYPGTTQDLNFNYRNSRINLFGNIGYSNRNGFEDYYILRNFRTDDGKEISTVYDQHTYVKNNNRRWNGKLGLDYYVSPRTTISASAGGYDNKGIFNTDNNTVLKNAAGAVETVVKAPARMDAGWKNAEADLGLKHSFDTAGHELQVDANYVSYDIASLQQFNNYYYDADGKPLERAKLFRADLPGTIKIYTAKTDYTRPLGHDDQLEAGLKFSYVTTDNNAQYLDQVDYAWIKNDSLSNHFLYNEKVGAAYLNYKRKISRWELQAGLRLEQTWIKGEQRNGSQTFDRSYLQLFPSAFLTYDLDEENKVGLSYSRRIERPDYRSLNPFRFYLDQYTYEEGNPYLQPQYSHNIELSYMMMEGAITTTLLYNRTSNVIQDLMLQNTTTKETWQRPENLNTKQVAGVSINAELPFSDNMGTVLYVDFNNYKYDGLINNKPFALSTNTFSGKLMQQVKMGHDWKVEFIGTYTSRAIDGTFIQRPVGTINVGLQKDLLDNRITFRLNATDIFNWNKFEGTSRYQNVDIYALNRWQTQALRFIFTYRFNSGAKLESREKEEPASPEKDRVKTDQQ